jgi:hypothetical protein
MALNRCKERHTEWQLGPIVFRFVGLQTNI